MRRWRVALALAGTGALAGAAVAAPDTGPAGIHTADPTHRLPADVVATAPPTLDVAPLSEQLLVAASADEVRPAPSPEAQPTSAAVEAAEPTSAPTRSVWDRVADCESGSWTGSGRFVESSANWSATDGPFEGGLQFHPDTWDGHRDGDMPAAAYDATRAQQIVVAERVLDAQGWQAWPVCSRRLGLR